jgi:hypothetical protein
VWHEIWRKFLSMLDEKGALDWQKAFIDGGFVPAKKGDPLLAYQTEQMNEMNGGGRVIVLNRF